MTDKVFYPCATLAPYVLYYWTCVHDQDVREVMFPTGSLELCIDISTGDTIRHRGDRSMAVPRVEILGHWNIPTSASIKKGNTCLITRFRPYAGSLFFPEQLCGFTNQSVDLDDIYGQAAGEFFCRIMDQPDLGGKVGVLEAFLLARLGSARPDRQKMAMVRGICDAIARNREGFDLRGLSAEFGVSDRYIQKLFLQYIGIAPKSFFSVQRFNKSLRLVRSADMSLTNIAYECGYYDQAHFIKDFRSYTGMAPSQLASDSVLPLRVS
jgi:AraC-like DNA-binding protein